MKSQSIVRILLLSGFAGLGTPALASDELAGLLIGAGTGALIGNSIDRHEGAVVGGIFGAILGAAIADDDDHYRGPAVSPRYPRHYYGPAPVVYQAPRVRYIEQPIIVEYRSSPYRWKEERRDRHEPRWQNRDKDRERRNDDRRDRRDW